MQDCPLLLDDCATVALRVFLPLLVCISSYVECVCNVLGRANWATSNSSLHSRGRRATHIS